jgi:hypothetical protein
MGTRILLAHRRSATACCWCTSPNCRPQAATAPSWRCSTQTPLECVCVCICKLGITRWANKMQCQWEHVLREHIFPDSAASDSSEWSNANWAAHNNIINRVSSRGGSHRYLSRVFWLKIILDIMGDKWIADSGTMCFFLYITFKYRSTRFLGAMCF